MIDQFGFWAREHGNYRTGGTNLEGTSKGGSAKFVMVFLQVLLPWIRMKTETPP